MYSLRCVVLGLLHLFPKLFGYNPTLVLHIDLMETGRFDEIGQFEEHIEILKDQLNITGRFDQGVHHLFANGACKESGREEDDHHCVLWVKRAADSYH